MANRMLVVFENGAYKVRSSQTETIDFLSVKVGGAAGIEIKATGGNFDFSGKKLVNIVAGAASGEAVEYDQFNTALSGKVSTSTTVNGKALSSNVTLTTDDVGEGSTNLYFTNARAKAAAVADSITDAVTDVAPSQNAVFDALALKISTSEKGANSGVATLDAGGKIPASQLPNSVMEFKGTWDASTNTPSLADGTGNLGDVYWVNVAGTQDLGSGSQTFAAGDFVIYDSNSDWKKSINSNAVASVNGQTGVVSLDTDDISEGSTNLYFTDARAKAATVSDTAYGAGWDGVTDVAPSKNAVYDIISTMGGSLVEDQIVDGVTTKAPSQNAVYDALALKANDADVVKSVNGQSPVTGAVTITTDNVAEGLTNYYYTNTRFDDRFATKNISDLGSKSHTALTDIGTNTHAQIDTHIASTSNPHSVTKTQVGLGNVDDVQQLPMSYLDIDGTLAANSDSKVASQKATKTYADGKVADSITDGVTTVAPSQNAVYDALALKTDISEKYKPLVNDNAGAITVRQVVYIKANGHVDLAKNDIAGLDAFPLGLVWDSSIATTATGNIRVKTGDIVGGFSGLTPTAKQYVSATAGTLTETAPTSNHVYLVGQAISATEIRFEPRHLVEIVA